MLPIGATVNMDGTALYQAVAVMFIAQVLNRDLTIAQQFGVFLSAIMVSIGTAGIPGGSIALMPLVLKQAGIGAEYIGIIIGVDRFLDMCRTVVNITGDSVGALVVSRSEGAIIKPRSAAALVKTETALRLDISFGTGTARCSTPELCLTALMN